MPFNYNEQLHVPPEAHPSCPVWKKGLPVSIFTSHHHTYLSLLEKLDKIDLPHHQHLIVF